MHNFYLLFDGNYLAYRTLFTIKNYSSKSKTLSDEASKGVFIRKIASDFLAVYNYFKADKVIFVKDSRSWRKEYYADYKGTREKSDDVDWESLFQLLDIFSSNLEKYGVINSKIDFLEGDDLLYLWSKKLNAEDKSAIIISADSDLNQLAALHDNSYTLSYNVKADTQKIYAPTGFKLKLFEQNHSVEDIFNLKNNSDVTKLNNLKNIVKNNSYEEIDTSSVLLHKVLCGDDSDNVPSVFITTVNNKKKRITNKDANKTIEYLKDAYTNIDINNIKYDKNLQNEIRLILEKSSKLKIDKTIFSENLYRNFHLIHLDTSEYKQELVDSFNIHVNNIEYNKKCKNLTKQNILDNTDYFNDKFIEIYSDGAK
jgi:5'-3' exonuclease